MQLEIWMMAGTWLTAIVAVGGVIAAYRKTGKDQAERDTEIRMNQSNIIKRLDDKDTGLSALARYYNQMQKHCASVSTSLHERVNATERDIRDMKSRYKG